MPIRHASIFLLVAACNGLSETDDFSPDAGESSIARTDPPPVCAIFYPTVTHSGGSILSPETWGNNRIHVVTGDVQVKAALTIGTCARVQIDPGKSIEVDAGGNLTTQTGVTLQPNTSAWGRLRIQAGTVTLNTTTIAGAGASGLPAVSLSGGTLNIQGVQITSSVGVGLEVTGGAIDPNSTTLTVTGSGAVPVKIPPNMLGQLPVGSYTGNATDEIVAPIGVDVSVSQTWHNVGVPYHISGANSELKVNGPSGSVAVLTIEPGTTLRFDEDTAMRIDSAAGKSTAASAALNAVGLGGDPIVFTAADPTKPWMGLRFGGAINTNGNTTQLSQARIEFAGGPDGSQFASCPTPFTPTQNNNPAAIRFDSGPPPATSFITFTTIANSTTNGIDRGFVLQSSTQAVPDFTATNAFDSVAFCAQTHPKSFFGACPRTPQCN